MTHRKPAESPRDLVRALHRGQRLMGLDVGTKTIGVALSDTGRIIASPYTTIRRRKFARDALICISMVQPKLRSPMPSRLSFS